MAVKTLSPQAKKRRLRRLRRNTDRLILRLHQHWSEAVGKPLPRGGLHEWENLLRQLFVAQTTSLGRGEAGEWLIAVLHAAAPLSCVPKNDGFQADLIGAAINLGVHVPHRVTTVRTMGPARRSEIIPNSLRVIWSRASQQ